MSRWQYGMVVRSSAKSGPNEPRMLIAQHDGDPLTHRYSVDEEYWWGLTLERHPVLLSTTLPGSWEIIDQGWMGRDDD